MSFHCHILVSRLSPIDLFLDLPHSAFLCCQLSSNHGFPFPQSPPHSRRFNFSAQKRSISCILLGEGFGGYFLHLKSPSCLHQLSSTLNGDENMPKPITPFSPYSTIIPYTDTTGCGIWATLTSLYRRVDMTTQFDLYVKLKDRHHSMESLGGFKTDRSCLM